MIKEKKVDRHTMHCKVCSEMAKRGYRSEGKYWDDVFARKEKPIKYTLTEEPKP